MRSTVVITDADDLLIKFREVIVKLKITVIRIKISILNNTHQFHIEMRREVSNSANEVGKMIIFFSVTSFLYFGISYLIQNYSLKH